MTEPMRAVDRTHPHTNDAFDNAAQGPAVATDGGSDTDETTETMADVDHESADNGIDRASERGTERRDETV